MFYEKNIARKDRYFCLVDYVECSSMVERQIVILNMRVQFPSLTPYRRVG